MTRSTRINGNRINIYTLVAFYFGLFHIRVSTLIKKYAVGKDLARYLYAAQARNDPRYLPLLPRAIRILKAAVESAAGWDPTLARLAEILATLPENP